MSMMRSEQNNSIQGRMLNSTSTRAYTKKMQTEKKEEQENLFNIVQIKHQTILQRNTSVFSPKTPVRLASRRVYVRCSTR